MRVRVLEQKISNSQFNEAIFSLLLVIAGNEGLRDEVLKVLKDCNIKHELKGE